MDSQKKPGCQFNSIDTIKLFENMEALDYKSFRVGNPVLVDNSVKYIKTLPNDSQGSFKGYTFYADGNVRQDVEPYPIDEDFLRVYEHLRISDVNEMCYRFQKEIERPDRISPYIGCVLKYFPSEEKCVISKIDWKEPLVLKVSALHELYNLIEDYCGYCLPKYYPHMNNMNL